MPVNETRAVQIIETKTRLTIREQRAFEQAERKIARGLKSFLEVGMASRKSATSGSIAGNTTLSRNTATNDGN
jgi:hypothetical protein